MQKLIYILLFSLVLASPAHALSPLEDNVHGKMLPVIVDEKVKPFYDRLSPEQRNCNGEAPKTIRLLQQDSPATMDHSDTRLNIELDVDSTILRAWCG